MTYESDLEAQRPATARDWGQIKPGDRLVSYIPGNASSMINLTVKSVDSHNQECVTITYVDLATNEEVTAHVGAIGLSRNQNDNSGRYVIPFEE